MDPSSPISIPKTRRAVIQSAKNPGGFELTTRPMPVLASSQVLIKVSAVALNQCDFKMPLRVPCPGAFVGADYAGTIVQVGESAARDYGWKIGDRVAGGQVAANVYKLESGSFTDYIFDEGDRCWRMPEAVSSAEAAAVGCAVSTTVGMALWKIGNLPGTPEQPILKPKYVLVYGGATATGTFTIQLLRLSGYKVVTTCSPKNFKMMESYGAEKAFDYHSPTCGEEIREYTKNTLEYVFDIITEARTIRHCYTAIGRGGGKYIGFELLPDDLIATMRKTVKADWVMGLELTGTELKLPGGYYRKENPELMAWGLQWIQRYVALLAEGKLKPHPVKTNPGGLDTIIDGIQAMRRKEISGQKMVYPL